MMSEDPIDVYVQRTGQDGIVRLTILPSMLNDRELGKMVRGQIKRLLMNEEALLDA